MKINKIYGFILFLTYSISIIPSFIFHEHNELHKHSESFTCESVSKHLEGNNECLNDVYCTHYNHFKQASEECFLCDNYAIYEYVLDSSKELYNDKILIDKTTPVCERLYLKDFANYHNKSPPVFI